MKLPGSTSHRVAGALLSLAFASYWLHLHFGELGRQLIGDDESHAVRLARASSYGEILTLYTPSDNSIPLTLYAKALMDTIGLSELALRLPVVVAHVLLLLSPLLLLRRLGTAVTAVTIALLATSPLVVHYAIVARPYTPAALCTFLAFCEWDRWMRTPGRRGLLSFGLLSAAAVFLHLFALVPVGTLLLLTLPEVRAGRVAFADWVRATALVGGLILLLLGPGLPGLVEHRLGKVGEGAPVTRMLRVSYFRLLGHLRPLGWLLPVLVAAGSWRLARRTPRLGRAAVTVALLHLVAIAASRPLGQPTVGARYFFVVWPIVLLLAAAGLEGAVDTAARALARGVRGVHGGPSRWVGIVTVALGLALSCYVPWASPSIQFRAGRSSFRTSKFFLLRMPPATEATGVFRVIEADPEGGDVLVVFPTLETASEKRAAWDSGLRDMYVEMASARAVADRREGIHFRHVLDVNDAEELARCGARYLVADSAAGSAEMRALLRDRYGEPVASGEGRDLYRLR